MDLLKQLSPRITPRPLSTGKAGGNFQQDLLLIVGKARREGICAVISICRLLAGIAQGHACSLVILEILVNGSFHRSTCQGNP